MGLYTLVSLARQNISKKCGLRIDFAGFVDPRGKFGMECGDVVQAPDDCDGICDDFVEVMSLTEHVGGTPVDAVPPTDTDSIVVVTCRGFG